MSTSSTTSLSTSSSVKGSFFFPHELLREIFSCCDPSTLAAVSRVSFACLELSSRFLYEDIVLSKALSIAKLLRILTPDKDLAPARTSARISAHTSLSLIHSFTFHGRSGDYRFYMPENIKTQVEPLSVNVLAASLPTEPFYIGRSSGPSTDIRSVLNLFNPRIFLILGCRPKEQLCRLPPEWIMHVLIGGFRTKPIWDRLTTVIQSGAMFCGSHIYGLEGIFRLSLSASTPSRPLRFIFDLLDVEVNPAADIAKSTVAHSFKHAAVVHQWEEWTIEDLYGILGQSTQRRPRPSHGVDAWVETEAMRDGLLKMIETSYPGRLEEEFRRSASVEIPSARVRRLRDEIVHHGVRKNLDWAALDEL